MFLQQQRGDDRRCREEYIDEVIMKDVDSVRRYVVLLESVLIISCVGRLQRFIFLDKQQLDSILEGTR